MGIIGGWRVKYVLAERAKSPRKPKARRDDVPADDREAVLRAVKLRRFPTCLLCPEPATKVHQMDYGKRKSLRPSPRSMVTLCGKCYNAIRFDGGTKRSPQRANAELRRRAHAAGLTRFLAMLNKLNADRKRERRKAKLVPPATTGKATPMPADGSAPKWFERFVPWVRERGYDAAWDVGEVSLARVGGGGLLAVWDTKGGAVVPVGRGKARKVVNGDWQSVVDALSAGDRK